MIDHASDHAAHFVPLAIIMSDFDGALQTYMQRNHCQNVVVTMPVEMDVAGKTRSEILRCCGRYQTF